MTTTEDFQNVFTKLHEILHTYESDLTIKNDTNEHYSLDGHYSQKFKRHLFFGSVQIKKNYVSFYLMPVYMYPELLDTTSTKLKNRMQGKSCFNFKKVDKALFDELSILAERSFERFQKEE